MWTEFRGFIARGNVIDLAVGVIIGAAFGRIVTTMVEGVLMPPLGLMLGRVDFASLLIVLDGSQGTPLSLADAKARGIPVIAYGQLINDILGFTIVALAVFVLVGQMNRLRRETVMATRACPHCTLAIAVNATRCPHCTSEVSPG
jgi:large conductance mechanosensitive channel